MLLKIRNLLSDAELARLVALSRGLRFVDGRVSITFIESFVVDAHQRTQIHELTEIAALEGQAMSWASRVRLDVVRQNLMRMWTST